MGMVGPILVMEELMDIFVLKRKEGGAAGNEEVACLGCNGSHLLLLLLPPPFDTLLPRTTTIDSIGSLVVSLGSSESAGRADSL